MNTWLEVGSDGGSGGNLAGYWPSVSSDLYGIPTDKPTDDSGRE
jgi:hypothetical protein